MVDVVDVTELTSGGIDQVVGGGAESGAALMNGAIGGITAFIMHYPLLIALLLGGIAYLTMKGGK